MSSKLLRLSIVGMVFVLAFTFGVRINAQAEQMRVDQDLAKYSAHDVNFFGWDKAYTSASGGPDQDASPKAYKFMPETYNMGLQNPRN